MAVNSGSSGGSAADSIRAGRAHVEMSMKDAGLQSGLKKFQRDLMAMGKAITLGGSGLIAGATSIIGPVTGLFAKFTHNANEISRLATKLGVSTEEMSQFAYACETTGMSLEDVTGQFENLAERVAQGAVGSGEAAATFQKLGIDAAKLQLQNPVEQMITLAEAMAGITNETERLGMLSSLGGDQFQWMNNLFKKGPDGIRGLMGEANKVGATLSGTTAEQAVRAGQAIDRAWAAAKNTLLTIGAALLPQVGTIERLSDSVVRGIGMARDFIQENREIVVAVTAGAAAVAGLGAAMVVIGGVMAAIGPVISGIATAVGFLAGIPGAIISAAIALPGLIAGIPAAIGAAAAAIPALVGGFAVWLAQAAAAVAIIGGLGAAIYYVATQTDIGASILESVTDVGGEIADYFSSLADQVMEVVSDIFDPFISTWSSIKNAIASGNLSDAFKLTIAAVKATWANAMVYIQQGWNTAEAYLSDSWVELQFEAEALWEKLKFVFESMAAVFEPEIEFMKKVWSHFVDGLITSAKVVGGILYVAFVLPFENMINVVARALRAIGRTELAGKLENAITGEIEDLAKSIEVIQQEANRGTADRISMLRREADLKKEIAQVERDAALAKRKEDRDAARAKLELLKAEQEEIRLTNQAMAVANTLFGVLFNSRGLMARIDAGARVAAVAGTFSMRNVNQSLFGGTTDKIEKNTSETATATKDIAGKVDNLKPRFT